MVCGYDLQCLSILARILFLEKKFRLKMPDTSIGFIGLNAAICRAAGIINTRGCLKVLGCDEDERKMMFLEKENGLATTPANVFANSDILCVLSADFDDADLKDLRPGVLVISMSGNPETEDRLRALRGCRECSVLQSVDLVRLLPGIISGMQSAGIQNLDPSCMLPLASFLLEAGIPADEADIYGEFHRELAERITTRK